MELTISFKDVFSSKLNSPFWAKESMDAMKQETLAPFAISLSFVLAVSGR